MNLFNSLIWIIHIVLIAFAVIFISRAMPYLYDDVHKNITDYRTEYIEPIGFVYFKLSTLDTFMANNPIDIEIATAAVDPDIRDISITFDGARKYFPIEFNCYISELGSEEKVDECHKKYWNHLDKLRESSIKLNKTSLTTFGGVARKIIYNTGGEFPLYFDIGYSKGAATVYGASIKYDRFIQIAPPETSLTIRNSNLMIGLSYLMISMSILVPAFTSFLHILSNFYFGSNANEESRSNLRRVKIHEYNNAASSRILNQKKNKAQLRIKKRSKKKSAGKKA